MIEDNLRSFMDTSIILPIKNQESPIKENFVKIFKYLERFNAELIVVENGSSDNSLSLLKQLGKKYPFKLIILKRSGRGLAVRTAAKVAKGDVIGYFDIDLAVPLKFLDRALYEFDNGYDVVIGNRYLKGSEIKRPLRRHIQRKVYAYLVRLFYFSRITDFQCGFKFFKRNFLKSNMRRANDDKFFFDTEILLLAERENKRILQMPVSYRDMKETTLDTDEILHSIEQLLKYRFSRNFSLVQADV